MESSLIVSIISAIIACGAYVVSYKSYSLSMKNRMNDKIQDLRINIVQLNSRLKDLTLKISSSKGDQCILKKMTVNLQGIASGLGSVNMSFENFDIDMSEKGLINSTVEIEKIKSGISILEKKFSEQEFS